MIVINVLEDIKKLKNRFIISEGYIEVIESKFQELYKRLSDENTPIEEFSLQEHGEIIIFEKEDEKKNLLNLGILPQNGKLIDTYPDGAQLIKENGLEIYDLLFVRTNENCINILVQKGVTDNKTEKWLKNQASYTD